MLVFASYTPAREVANMPMSNDLGVWLPDNRKHRVLHFVVSFAWVLLGLLWTFGPLALLTVIALSFAGWLVDKPWIVVAPMLVYLGTAFALGFWMRSRK